MTSFSRLALLTALALPSLLAGCGSDSGGDTGTSDPPKTECTPGETKAAADGCNTCSCQRNGFFACTEIACAPTACKTADECFPLADLTACQARACESGVCKLNAVPGCVDPGDCKAGEQKPAPDGCNTCTCQPDGTFACTEIACAIPCKTAADCPTAPPNGCALAVCEQGICGFSPDPTCPGNPCAPQDAAGYGACGSFLGYAWNGQECDGIIGCSCQGADCKGLSFNLDECSTAHASCGSTGSCQSDKDCPESCTTCNGTKLCVQGDCQLGTCSPPSFPPCAPSASPGGTCYQPGSTAPASDGCNTCTCSGSYAWDCTKKACPSSCTTSSDCTAFDPDGCVDCLGINNCGQAYCDTLPESGVCKTIAPSCGDSCEPQDIKGVGPCAAFFGVAWNGKSCESVGGCSCQGKDCGQIYQDQATCNAIHQSCVVPF